MQPYSYRIFITANKSVLAGLYSVQKHNGCTIWSGSPLCRRYVGSGNSLSSQHFLWWLKIFGGGFIERWEDDACTFSKTVLSDVFICCSSCQGLNEDPTDCCEQHFLWRCFLSLQMEPSFLSINYIDIQQAQILLSRTPFSSPSIAGNRPKFLLVQQEKCMWNHWELSTK